MVVYIGSDHKGFELKGHIFNFLKEQGYEVTDMGNHERDENDDYPDFAAAVAKKVSHDYENARGIVVCGSGVGVEIVANKFRRVRAGLVFNTDQAFDVRNDDNTNILALSADHTLLDEARKIVSIWLETPFSGEMQHERRVKKIDEIEEENLK